MRGSLQADETAGVSAGEGASTEQDTGRTEKYGPLCLKRKESYGSITLF